MNSPSAAGLPSMRMMGRSRGTFWLEGVSPQVKMKFGKLVFKPEKIRLVYMMAASRIVNNSELSYKIVSLSFN